MLVHDGRALETYELGHSSVPRSPTSFKAAILTYSTFDCSDAAHTMPLTSSLISQRFSREQHLQDAHSTSVRLHPTESQPGDTVWPPRDAASDFSFSAGSARMKLARFCVRKGKPLVGVWKWPFIAFSHLTELSAVGPDAGEGRARRDNGLSVAG